jgi:hypothetical protein
VVAPGHQARPRRRAQRRGVEVGVGQAAPRDPVDVRRLDQPAVGPHRRVPDVIEHDVEHARRALGGDRLGVRLPVRHRLGHIDVDHTAERLRHDDPS